MIVNEADKTFRELFDLLLHRLQIGIGINGFGTIYEW